MVGVLCSYHEHFDGFDIVFDDWNEAGRFVWVMCARHLKLPVW